MKLNNRGQGLVETVLSLPVFLSVVAVIALLLYHSLVFHIADYQAHEALICVQSEETHFCKREFESRLREVLLKGATYKVQLSKSSWQGHEIDIEIVLNQGWEAVNIPIKIKKSL